LFWLMGGAAATTLLLEGAASSAPSLGAIVCFVFRGRVGVDAAGRRQAAAASASAVRLSLGAISRLCVAGDWQAFRAPRVRNRIDLHQKATD